MTTGPVRIPLPRAVRVPGAWRLPRLDWAIAAAVALMLPALSVLAYRALPRGGDLLLHYYRTVALDATLRRGLLYTRWMPDLVYGYGYPLFHFYAPLSSYLSEAIHLAGASFPLSMRLMSALTLAALGLGTYLWARDLLGSARAGWVAVAAAVYAPFVLSTPLARGSLSDGLALALLPFAFWGLCRLAQRPTIPRLAVAALLVAALLLSHNVTALVSYPVLALYGFAVTGKTRRRGPVLVVGALLLGLALSAFFWLPALADRGWTRLDLFIAEAEYDYRANFSSPGQLLRWPVPAETGLMNPPGPYHANPVVLVLGAIGVAWAWRVRLQARAALTLLWAAGLGLLFLNLPQSAWLWERIPLLPVIQFPFRLLGPASILLAAPAAAALAGPGSGRAKWAWQAAPVAIALLLVLPSIPVLYPLRLREPLGGSTLSDVTRYQQAAGALGTTSSGEYLPKTIEDLPEGPAFPGMDLGASLAAKLDASTLPSGTRCEAVDRGSLAAEWHISAPAAFTAVVHTFYFPGWQAWLDGRPLDVAPAPQTGLIRCAVPAGEHRLILRYGPTPVTALADGLSIAAAVVLVLLLAGYGIRVPVVAARLETFARLPLSGTAWVPLTRAESVLLGVLGLSLLVLKVAWLDRFDSPWRRGYDGQHVPGARQEVQVDLGGQVRLLAFDPLPARLAPGQTAPLVLYWGALKPLDGNYSASVQIIDDRLNKIAHVDHYRPGGYPTAWWPVSEYNRDSYQLRIDPGARPGTYSVLVVLYHPVTGQRLVPAPGVPGAERGALEVQRIQVEGGA